MDVTMNTFLEWLSKNPTVATLFIISLSGLVITIILIYVKAFLEGRSVSFWPPKIGEKPVSPVITAGKSQQVKPMQGLHTKDNSIMQERVTANLEDKEQHPGEESQFEKLGHTVRSFGIATITRQWSELSQFDGDLGREFKERLKGVKSPATWYIITMSPEAFSGAAQ